MSIFTPTGAFRIKNTILKNDAVVSRVEQTCTKIVFRGIEISIAMDDSCGAMRDLGRTSLCLFRGEENVTREFMGGEQDEIPADAETLFEIVQRIDSIISKGNGHVDLRPTPWQTDDEEYEPKVGESVEWNAREMVVRAKKSNRPVRARIHGFFVTAWPHDDVSTVVTSYWNNFPTSK